MMYPFVDKAKFSFILAAILYFSSANVFAWGERGHNAITLVAVRSLKFSPENNDLFRFFLEKEHLLAHLSNVPDIVWRSKGQEIESLNGPTHFIDLEYLGKILYIDQLPRSNGEQILVVQKQCRSKSKETLCPGGTPPEAGQVLTRIHQIHRLLIQEFSLAHEAQKKSPPSPENSKKHLEKVLLYSGILSHFVGDLTNPLHTTYDYDGYQRNQGGLHAYFETAVVNHLDLASEADALNRIAVAKGLDGYLKDFFARASFSESFKKSSKYTHWRNNAFEVGAALALESHTHLPALFKLDQSKSLIAEGSKDQGLKIPAKRKPPEDVTSIYKPLILDRWALGGAILAHLWIKAYQESGKPSLKDFKSFYYPVAPEFITPTK